MKTNKILIISNNDAVALSAWAVADAWEAVFAGSDEQALELAQQQPFGAIVVDGTDGSLNPLKLRALLPILQPDVAVFHYAGEGTDTLRTRVKDHFVRLRYERIRRFLVLDDSRGASWSQLPQFSAN
ncbi:hypothetical protein [Flaviaesturariibacter amylovorans]|uniref:Response regulator transcription factor n=1 Tax=Flaviaesturariibacter amylovorans TaxID=1084520 RepID=A0ABP8G762_9BACT